jgi:hypothetical protein
MMTRFLKNEMLHFLKCPSTYSNNFTLAILSSLVIYKVRPHVEGLLAARALFEGPYVQDKVLGEGHSEDKGPRTRGEVE